MKHLFFILLIPSISLADQAEKTSTGLEFVIWSAFLMSFMIIFSIMDWVDGHAKHKHELARKLKLENDKAEAALKKEPGI